MSELQEKQEGPGRPSEYTEDRKPVTTWWPVSILDYVDSTQGRGNRTKWLIEAAREKMEREQFSTSSKNSS